MARFVERRHVRRRKTLADRLAVILNNFQQSSQDNHAAMQAIRRLIADTHQVAGEWTDEEGILHTLNQLRRGEINPEEALGKIFISLRKEGQKE